MQVSEKANDFGPGNNSLSLLPCFDPSWLLNINSLFVQWPKISVPPVGIVIGSMCWNPNRTNLLKPAHTSTSFLFKRKACLGVMILWYNTRYIHFPLFIQCYRSLCSCRRFIKCRNRISSWSSPSSWQSLLDLTPQFTAKLQVKACWHQAMIHSAYRALAFHSFTLPTRASFLCGTFAAPPTLISVPVLLCLFSTVLYFITSVPFLPSPCVSSASSHAELWEIWETSYTSSLVFDRVENRNIYTCRCRFLNCRNAWKRINLVTAGVVATFPKPDLLVFDKREWLAEYFLLSQACVIVQTQKVMPLNRSNIPESHVFRVCKPNQVASFLLRQRSTLHGVSRTVRSSSLFVFAFSLVCVVSALHF